MSKLSVSIVGGSGFAGGELLRILLFHPHVHIQQVTSERLCGKPISRVHPNLRGITKNKFCSLDALKPCDVLFLALPHGAALKNWPNYLKLAHRIIDLSADFRLRNTATYQQFYGQEHPYPELLEQFIYGIPELHRPEMENARFISSAGCNATAIILALAPLFGDGLIDPTHTIVEVKGGSSQGGNKPNQGSHHPVRSGSFRSYKPTGHRHTAEVLQELRHASNISTHNLNLHMTASSVDAVRGVQATCHTFLNAGVDEREIWKAYRKWYREEPFIRLVKERDGVYRYPDPKLLTGTNYCDIGFEKDPLSNRLVVISAIDNLVKGASGQAVQAMNIMCGFEETTSLSFPGLHPV